MADDRLAVGRVAKAHGVRGEVSVEPLTDAPDRFSPGAVLRSDEGTLTVATARRHGRRLLVRFEGIDDRTAADALRGTMLFVPGDQAVPLPEGAYWPRDLEGCEVITEGGARLGPITEVLANPANDVWVTERALIPAVRDVVREVDLRARRVLIRDLPGLVEE